MPWGPDRRVDVLQEEHGAAFALQQGQRSLHDLPHDLLQVSLLLKQVVDHLKQSLWPHKGGNPSLGCAVSGKLTTQSTFLECCHLVYQVMFTSAFDF